MSQENVETVRGLYETVAKNPESSRALFAPQFELDVREPSPDFGVLRGFDIALEALREYWDTFEDFQTEVEEVIHADEEMVVTAVRDHGRLRGSDLEMASDRRVHVWIFDRGKVARLSVHTDRARALEAAGLSE